MAAPVLTVGTRVFCPHEGTGGPLPSTTRVRFGGQLPASLAPSPLTGCKRTLPAPPPPSEVPTGQRHQFRVPPPPCVAAIY